MESRNTKGSTALAMWSMGKPLSFCHSGTTRSVGPGIHTPQHWGYGCRARGLRPRPGMTSVLLRERSSSQAAVLGLKFGCTMAPSRVSSVPLTISSSQLTASFFSFLSIMVSRNCLLYTSDAADEEDSVD